jgi:hypothetical protein
MNTFILQLNIRYRKKVSHIFSGQITFHLILFDTSFETAYELYAPNIPCYYWSLTTLLDNISSRIQNAEKGKLFKG